MVPSALFFLLFSSDFTFVKYEIRGLGAEPPTSILYNFRAAENCTKVREWVPTCDACYSLFPGGNRGFYAPGRGAFAALMPRPPYRSTVAVSKIRENKCENRIWKARQILTRKIRTVEVRPAHKILQINMKLYVNKFF